jgi:hypothetical protein
MSAAEMTIRRLKFRNGCCVLLQLPAPRCSEWRQRLFVTPRAPAPGTRALHRKQSGATSHRRLWLQTGCRRRRVLDLITIQVMGMGMRRLKRSAASRLRRCNLSCSPVLPCNISHRPLLFSTSTSSRDPSSSPVRSFSTFLLALRPLTKLASLRHSLLLFAL